MAKQVTPPAESQFKESLPNFPKIVYRGEPVVTTDSLALAYETDSVRIRQNFNKNKNRFSDGKHFFSVTGNDLKSLHDGVAKSYAMNESISMPNLRGPHVTFYTKRGAALHAKMLNTDTAWSVYEGMVDFYFDSIESKAFPVATKDERRPLVDAVRTWVKMTDMDYSLAHRQVNAMVGVSSVDQMTKEQVAVALDWVRQHIDSLSKATHLKALTEADEIMVSLERLGMIIRKVREVCKSLPTTMETELMRYFLKKSGYLTD